MIAPIGAASGILAQATASTGLSALGARESLTEIGFLAMTLLFAMVSGKGPKGPRMSGAQGGGPYRGSGRPDPASSLEGEILSIHPDGRGREIKLSKDQKIGGDMFPRGSTLTFDENGLLSEAVLARKAKIRGFLCAPKGPVVLEKDGEGVTRSREVSVIFHQNGRLRQFALGEDRTIEKALLKSGTIVYFREDGRLQSLFLKSEQEIRGLRLPRQTSVSFHENGTFASLHFIPFQKKVEGLPGFEGSFIAFDDEGNEVRRG